MAYMRSRKLVPFREQRGFDNVALSQGVLLSTTGWSIADRLSPEQEAAAHERSSLVLCALPQESLPLFDVCWRQELSLREASRVLGQSYETVRKRKLSLQEKMRHVLEKMGLGMDLLSLILIAVSISWSTGCTGAWTPMDGRESTGTTMVDGGPDEVVDEEEFVPEIGICVETDLIDAGRACLILGEVDGCGPTRPAIDTSEPTINFNLLGDDLLTAVETPDYRVGLGVTEIHDGMIPVASIVAGSLALDYIDVILDEEHSETVILPAEVLHGDYTEYQLLTGPICHAAFTLGFDMPETLCEPGCAGPLGAIRRANDTTLDSLAGILDPDSTLIRIDAPFPGFPGIIAPATLIFANDKPDVSMTCSPTLITTPADSTIATCHFTAFDDQDSASLTIKIRIADQEADHGLQWLDAETFTVDITQYTTVTDDKSIMITLTATDQGAREFDVIEDGSVRTDDVPMLRSPLSSTVISEVVVDAAQELCDGRDNDLDGETDEGLDCTMNTMVPCSCGWRTCGSDCTWSGVCIATTESPNGHDDDCDGIVDDGFGPDTGEG